ncbi:MAG TPA: NAD(P)-dependent alcohol dehydrogenase [Gaiellaceae bacterium]
MATTATVPTTTMKAVIRRAYGSPDVLELAEVEKPELADDGALVRVRATSINRADWYTLNGAPTFARPMMGGLRRPKSPLLGCDFAGVVEAVGKDVTDLEPDDEVFGGRDGAFAEYVCPRVGIARKPANLSFEEAAALPIAALTALQGLRDKGALRPGETVLINGASGGVGTFAVQIAKAFGAEVTAVCSTGNVEQARALRADHVIDYTHEDFTRSGRRHDLMFDNAGSRSWLDCARVLAPHARVVLVGGPMGGFFGPLGHIAAMRMRSLGSGRKVVFFLAKFNRPDLAVLRDLAEDGKLRPVIDRRYQFAEIADALRYMGEGHARGKVVVTV